MEINIRAWHELNNEMVYPKVGALSSGDILNRFSPEWIMLGSGEIDLLNKEVYSGDIIQTITGQILQVIYEDACFYTPKPNSRYRLSGWKKGTFKVIGNVFENDLLQLRSVALMDALKKFNAQPNEPVVIRSGVVSIQAQHIDFFNTVVSTDFKNG